MNQTALIRKTERFVKDKLKSDGTGHDWWHVYRVWRLAKHIAQKEQGADLLVVELGALLHDIADWKFHDGDTTVGPRVTREWLRSQKVDESIVEQVAYIVEHISFRGGTNMHVMQTLEGQIVQDADRLDALGAIGIARLFTFGGSAGRPLYDPNIKPKNYASFDSFKKYLTANTSINHFYEKVLLLKDGMHTKTARQIARRRHRYIEKFLEEFYGEWEGKF
jgi:uncharacterized protein